MAQSPVRTSTVRRMLAAAGLAAAALAAPAGAHAQAPEWRFERSPSGQTLRTIAAYDHDLAWLAGGDGDGDCVIGRTRNGGAHWEGIRCDVGRRPESMAFADDRHGWIVGRAGLILRTTDGGSSWHEQRSGTGEAILNVFALDTQRAFAVTRGAEILATTDGGARWTRRTSGSDEGLFDSFWFDANHGLIAGSAGYIARSTDAGRKWRRIATGSDQRFYAITFPVPDRGYALGNDLRFSSDGGESWRRQMQPDKTMADIAFAPESPVHGWIIGDEGLILRTVDGFNWFPDGDGLTNRSIRGLAVVDAENVWAVGTGGILMHRVGPRAAPPTPTAPPATPVPPTRTPVPPTATATQTATATPTPRGPWVAVRPEGLPLLVGPVGVRALTLAFGNLGASAAISATLTGPVRFANGDATLSTTVFPIAGAGTFPIVVRPADGAASGQPWSLRVAVDGAAPVERGGVIAWQARLPKLNIRHR